MQFVTADASEALGTLGTFDLVFADASPSKYRFLETTLKALRPGGVLLVDDLMNDMRTSEQATDR